MIEFRALGPADLAGPEGTDPGAVLARPKLLGVLAFLSVGARRGFHRRDSLIGCFWPELSQERARSAVRQCLYRLRQSLGEAVVVTRGDDEVALSDAEFWSDVAAFDDALSRGDRAAALALYRGDLLDGLYVPDAPEFERWLEERRKDLRQRASTAAWELADQEAGVRHTAEAGRWGRQARDLAPFDERLLRRVIKLLDRLGDRAGAVREYETFARRLADELELEPSPETKALIDGVRRRSDPVVPEAALPRPEPPVPGTGGAPAASAGPAFGTVFADRYRVEHVIGSGGMATVYRARDLRHDRDVAVKVMRADLAAHLGADRFLREIRIVANLTHPHIVPVYDSGLEDGRLYFVMPFINGESLRDRLEREGQLSLEEALGYAGDVANALDYAHGQGVVHRDVKPENILLVGDQALVADFGIARALTTPGGSRLTRTGVAVGTPSYMSPEQAGGVGEADHRADLYSLGCVVYEMLAGQPPFTGVSAESIAHQHLTATPRPVTEFRANVPEHVSAALDKVLAKTPADRFGRASQFARALTTGFASRRRPRRRTVAWLVTALAVLVAGVALARWSRAPPLDRFRVVVVPFENRTGDTTLALVGNLAADWIARGLQEIDVIEVVPTATSITPGPAVRGGTTAPAVRTARSVALATRAGTVVAGAYYRRGDSLAFETQIIDAIDERLLRAVAPVTAPQTASGTGLGSLRRTVVMAVAAALDHRLFASPAANAPPSLEAYRAYIEGHRAFYHAGPPRMRETLEFMYRAVSLDTMFADPRFFIVMAHFNLGEFQAADSNVELLLPFRSQFSPIQRAYLDWLVANMRGDRAGALRAARARGSMPDVAVEALWSNRPFETIDILTGFDQLTLPIFYYKWSVLMEALHMVGQHERELGQARRARARHPDRLTMLRSELEALAALGRLDEVDRGLNESLLLAAEGEIDAGTVMLTVSEELRAHGHQRASVRVAERGLAWFESRPVTEARGARWKVRQGEALYAAERWEAARRLFRDLAVLAPDDVVLQGYLGVLAARQGDRDEALRRGARLDSLATPYGLGRHLFWQARIAAQLGERDQAVSLLREAHLRGRFYDISLHRLVDLAPLRGYAPFEEFLAPKQ